MSDISFKNGAADALAARLNTAKAELGRPHEGRWRWWQKRRRSVKVSKVLRETTPAIFTRYYVAKQGVTYIARDVRRTRRRYVLWLWVRIGFAAIWAVISRLRMMILSLALITGLGAVGYFYGPFFIRFLSEPATIDDTEDANEDQNTPSSGVSPAPGSPAAQNAPSAPLNGADIPSSGDR